MNNNPFYKSGGTLGLDAASYVTRRADEDLFSAIRAGEFCYILDSRQVGKSSLMAHSKRRLEEAGVAVAAVELTALGISSTTPEQWYDALLAKIGAQLGLEDALEDFWFEHERLAPLPRFLEALRQVVLERRAERVAIFLDEIDVVRSLHFATDELFAGIRELYNRRTLDPALERLSFCLIGVAQPTDLIQDSRITPFNIGRRIELTDFTSAEAAPLAQGLPGNASLSSRLLARVLYWTGGHPYLTQRLCQAVAEDGQVSSPRGVDRVCENLFFSVRARDDEHNLKFVSGHLLRADIDRAALLDLYRQVRVRQSVRDDPTNLLLGVLRLSGIVRTLQGQIWVRNRIYFRAFDRDWIRANVLEPEAVRQQAAYRRGLNRMGVAAALVIVPLAGSLYFIWDRYYRIQEEYFTTYVKRWGSLEGVGPVGESERGHRAVSFKFIRYGRAEPVVTVEAVDAAGRCTTRHDVNTYFRQSNPSTPPSQTECRWQFVRDERAQIVYEKAFNADGKLIWGLVYSPDVAGQPRRAHFVGANGFPAPQLKSTAEIIEFDYTPEGWERERRYFDRAQRPQPGRDGAYGQQSEYDERGLLRRLISLDAHGQPMVDRDNAAIATVVHDDRGNRIEVAYFDTGGRPTTHVDGFHAERARYDERGNLVEVTYFDTHREPAHEKSGLHKLAFRYDERGNPIERSFFDVTGQATNHMDGFHRATALYDQRGNLVEEAYFDTRGRPTRLTEGFHKLAARYDERGNRIERFLFDTEGQPTSHSDGFHMATARYDERGNTIEEAYFDAKGRPMTTAYGHHKVTSRYSDRGDLTEEAFYGISGQPTSIEDGYHKVNARYDERGNPIEVACFDTEGRPTRHKDNYHRLTARYDERGNQTERAYFDTEGQPTRTKEGYHRFLGRYDERGHSTDMVYFDTQGRPILR